MREILFRGKRKDNGEWVFGDLVRLKDGARAIPHIYGCGEIILSTVGQYTGLTDKNGKKIFEGDVLRCGNVKGAVKYSNKRAAFMFKWRRFNFHGSDFFKECGLADFGEFSGLEVIGNIHDNPELLEVSGDE